MTDRMTEVRKLMAQQAELAKQIEDAKKEITESIFLEISKMLADNEIPVHALIKYLAPKHGVRIPRASPQPKYRLPSGETWSGRGRMLTKLREYLQQNPATKLEDLRVASA